MIPNFHEYRWVIINSSGGKDSQTAMTRVVECATSQGYPLDRVVVSHQHLGKSEWSGTLELVTKQAEHYGLGVVVSQYRDRNGFNRTLLDYVRKRGKWPDNKNRFCTSEFKRGPGGRVIAALYREAKGDVLNVYGFRSEESPARAKKKVFVKNERFSSKSRTVHDWLPIHDWTEHQVWESIKKSGIPYHKAYDYGMPRLSCVFCIFAPKAALMIAGKHNPALLKEYVDLENEIGHTFKNNAPISEIKEALDNGVVAVSDDMNGNWNM